MKRLRFKALLMLIAGLCMSVSVFAQQMTVTGVVKDPTGEPVIGANVIIKGTTNGTVTDIDGKFLLSALKAILSLFHLSDIRCRNCLLPLI